jgi:hypothetical protein
MKKCNVCGAQASNDAAVCANDGEASFGPVFDMPEPGPVTQPSEAEPLFQPATRNEKRKSR